MSISKRVVILILLCFVGFLESTIALAEETGVKVNLWVDAEKNKPDNKAEIWAKGLGSWFMKNAIEQGADGRFVPLKIGQSTKVYLYPLGRKNEKQVIEIPVKLTNEMCSSGCPRDALMITIFDNQIEIIGAPLKAATGEKKIKRAR